MYTNVQKSYNLDLLRGFRNVQNVQFVQNLLSRGISSRSDFENINLNKPVDRGISSNNYFINKKYKSEDLPRGFRNVQICTNLFSGEFL